MDIGKGGWRDKMKEKVERRERTTEETQREIYENRIRKLRLREGKDFKEVLDIANNPQYYKLSKKGGKNERMDNKRSR